MSNQASQAQSRKPNGVLPMPASQAVDSVKGKASNDGSIGRSAKGRAAGERRSDSTKTESEAPKPARAKASSQGVKLVVRRLPPGMTQEEFVSILGPDWEVGGGAVDWFSYAPGKISKDPYKPSRPGRAYFHVMKKESIMPLSDTVRNSVWEDTKAAASNSPLVGPPVLELSIYKKVPSSKKRTDQRQGTIDQDPEFMAFLEELANPAPIKDGPEDDLGEDSTKSDTKITTTPLIEFLKEKKTRAKEATSNKKDKHGRAEGGSGKGKSSKDDDPAKKRNKEAKGEKSEKSREKVKILTKKAATEQAAEAAKVAAGQINSSSAQDAPKSRRAGIAAAARILQRDLGLSPGSAHRRARQDAAKADAEAKATTSKDAGPTVSERTVSPERLAESGSQEAKSRPSTPPAPPKSQTAGRRGRGGRNADKAKATENPSSQPVQLASNAKPPVILKKKSEADQPSVPAEPSVADQKPSVKQTADGPNPSKPPASKPSSQKKPPSISPDATRGFVKHANSSQRITEAALKEALGAFGTVTGIEMDKRKGFAFVDFADHEGLVKAIHASPVTVAQGSVQVVERKDKKPAAPTAAAGASNQNGSGGSEKNSNRSRRGKGGSSGGGKPNAAASTPATESAG